MNQSPESADAQPQSCQPKSSFDLSRWPADRPYLFARYYLDSLIEATGLSRREVTQRVRDTFTDVCVQLNPTLVLEVGAFKGPYARTVGSETEARVVAYEANPAVHERFRADMAAAKVDYRHAAVQDRAGRVALLIPTEIDEVDLPADGNLGSLKPNLLAVDHERVDVPAVRLDDEFPDTATERVVLWVDAAGANEQVLNGASRVIGGALAVLVTVQAVPRWEGQWLDTDVARFFAGHGFTLVAKDHPSREEFALVFIRSDLAADPWLARQAAQIYRVSDATPRAVRPPNVERLSARFRKQAERAAQRARLGAQPESLGGAEAPTSVTADAAALAVRIKGGLERRVRERIKRPKS